MSLYEFSWFLRGLKRGLSEDEIADICQQAYDEITRRHRLQAGVVRLARCARHARPIAEPGTPLDFDINTKGTIDSPFLALVPDQAALK